MYLEEFKKLSKEEKLNKTNLMIDCLESFESANKQFGNVIMICGFAAGETQIEILNELKLKSKYFNWLNRSYYCDSQLIEFGEVLCQQIHEWDMISPVELAQNLKSAPVTRENFKLVTLNQWSEFIKSKIQ